MRSRVVTWDKRELSMRLKMVTWDEREVGR